MRQVALDWLTRRDYSRSEIRGKLARRFDPRNPRRRAQLARLPSVGLAQSAATEVDDDTAAQSLSADIDAVLSWLEEYHFIDEARYLAVLLRSALERGHGELRLRQELRQRGLPAPLVEQALAELTVDWLALAREVRERRFGNRPVREPKEKARQLRFLQYRGFTAEQCFAALGADPDDDTFG